MAALAPKKRFSVEWFVFLHVSEGWLNSFWHSFGSVTVFVIVIVVDIAVRVRGIGVTLFVSGNICSRCFFNQRH